MILDVFSHPEMGSHHLEIRICVVLCHACAVGNPVGPVALLIIGKKTRQRSCRVICVIQCATILVVEICHECNVWKHINTHGMDRNALAVPPGSPGKKKHQSTSPCGRGKPRQSAVAWWLHGHGCHGLVYKEAPNLKGSCRSNLTSHDQCTTIKHNQHNPS